jgi:lysophospholipase L1-like esterase
LLKKINIYIAGDSTAATKTLDKRPETGWGQMIQEYFEQKVEIKNFAVNGRSSKSFIDEKYLDKILENIKEDNFLLIQFGHNDQKPDVERHTDPFSTYKEYLTKYIVGARAAGAKPILLTSVHRRFFDQYEKIEDTHGDYLAAMRELALDMSVPLIDVAVKSKALFEKIGIEKTKKIFLWLAIGENPNYPNGVEDNTHFCEEGARVIAELIVQEIVEQHIEPLSELVKIKL